MTARVFSRPQTSRLQSKAASPPNAARQLAPPRPHRFSLPPLALILFPAAAAVMFVTYVLWPRWPSAPVPLDAPAIPVTVAGVLFNVPPAAIRVAVQRRPGAHERLDLHFAWPSLTPPRTEVGETDAKMTAKAAAAMMATTKSDDVAIKRDADGNPVPDTADNRRVFVTIAALGGVLNPIERLRSIYPRYMTADANAGPNGLAILPFRAGTPYEGEDLIYVADQPERFFARCTRQNRAVPGTCIYELTIDAAVLTLRFPRDWLDNWQAVAAGFDRLITQLHPKAG
jgi:hypothetical protein